MPDSFLRYISATENQGSGRLEPGVWTTRPDSYVQCRTGTGTGTVGRATYRLPTTHRKSSQVGQTVYVES